MRPSAGATAQVVAPSLPPEPRSLETVRAHVRRLSYLAPLRQREPSLAYVGWLGYGNAGDEALLDAFRLAFSDRPVSHVSHEKLLWLARATGMLRGRVAGVVLGGGTLIGHPTFRRHLEWLLQAVPGQPSFALGTGVLDPAFPDRPRDEAEHELKRWLPLLHRLKRVSMRGPLSRELLATLGVDARIVGDPALLLRPPLATPREDHHVLGLNVGLTFNAWGSDSDRLLRSIVAVGRDWTAAGGRVELFPMWGPDVSLSREAAGRIGGHVSVFTRFAEVDTLLSRLQRCHVFVGMKLHSIVLAAAAGVPGVMIEYQPKCRDFHASVGRERFTLRSDELDPERLRELTSAVTADRDEQAAELATAVDEHRAALAREVAEVNSILLSAR